MTFEHKPVLLEETVESLNIQPGGTYVDGTLGGGGHAFAVLSRLGGQGRLIGIDQDGDAIEAAKRRLEGFGSRAAIVRGNYEELPGILDSLGIDKVEGVYLDLGVSSYQLDTASRGFTYRDPMAPLDMRMDQRGGRTAADIVNTYEEQELYRILRDYGEERFAKNIARHIVAARQKKALATTGDLVEVVKASIPMKMRASGGHPAKRTFQALRIELNRELEVLDGSLDAMIGRLKPGGAAKRDYVPLPGRQDGEELLSEERKPLPVPAGISGVYVRESGERQGGYAKAPVCHPGGAGREHAGKERKIAGI